VGGYQGRGQDVGKHARWCDSNDQLAKEPEPPELLGQPSFVPHNTLTNKRFSARLYPVGDLRQADGINNILRQTSSLGASTSILPAV